VDPDWAVAREKNGSWLSSIAAGVEAALSLGLGDAESRADAYVSERVFFVAWSSSSSSCARHLFRGLSISILNCIVRRSVEVLLQLGGLTGSVGGGVVWCGIRRSGREPVGSFN